MRVLASILLSMLSASSCATPPQQLPEPSEPSEQPVDWAARLERSPRSEELERLAVLCGSWDVVVEDLGGTPQPSLIAKGRAEIEGTLGGRFLRWETELSLGERSVRAEGRLGFDAPHDVFQLVWLSELASGMRIASGRGDARRGGLVLELSERDPESGMLLRARSILKLEDDDHFSLTQLGLDAENGEWVAQQRTSYVRRSASAAAQVPAG
jgi:hypothetical protein